MTRVRTIQIFECPPYLKRTLYMTGDAESLVEGLKTAMQNAPATVTVVTTGRSLAEANGLTATSVCSVSFDPPSILVCVNRDSNSHQVIADTGKFCANYLSLQQKEIAGSFASPGNGAEKFERADVCAREEDGWIAIDDALANIFCEVTESFEAGTHTIFIGAVKRVAIVDGGAPLLYGMQGFGRFAPD